MTSKFRPTGSGWAMIALGLSVLALGGCGRKGPLDLPPTASSASSASLPGTPDTEREAESRPGVFNPTYGSEAAPAAAKGNKKSFILDPLLDKR